jgi:hypothetical protein
MDLSKVFDEYLRTTMVPVLEYRLEGDELSYRWTDVVPGFAMPVRVTLAPGDLDWISPTESWQTIEVSLADPKAFSVDENFYVKSRDVSQP